MWQSTIHTVTNVQGSFSAFLETDEFVNQLAFHERQNHEDPTVLDIVGLWLSFEDNILVVPSFEELLVSLVAIVDDWLLGDKKSVGGIPLWPHQTTGEAQTVSSFARANDGADRDLDLEVGRSHSVLLRQNFDAHRAEVIANQQSRIETHLRQLVELMEAPNK